MTSQAQPVSHLRERLIEDMQLRKLTPKTQSGYIRNIKKLADYLGHSPHTATKEELRQFQLSLVKNDTSRISIKVLIKVLIRHPS